jgi:hypothetical protein
MMAAFLDAHSKTALPLSALTRQQIKQRCYETAF